MKLILIISFIIHLILIYAIYLLFQQIQTLKNDDKQEWNDELEHFLQEIKRENELLEAKITQSVHAEKDVRSSLKRQTTDERATMKKFAESRTKDYSDLTIANKEETSYENNIEQLISEKQVDDIVETSLESMIINMHHEGQSIEDIARKTNRGKTEVKLMLKLNDNYE